MLCCTCTVHSFRQDERGSPIGALYVQAESSARLCSNATGDVSPFGSAWQKSWPAHSPSANACIRIGPISLLARNPARILIASVACIDSSVHRRRRASTLAGSLWHVGSYAPVLLWTLPWSGGWIRFLQTGGEDSRPGESCTAAPFPIRLADAEPGERKGIEPWFGSRDPWNGWLSSA